MAAEQNQLGDFIDDEEEERFVGVELWRRCFVGENTGGHSSCRCSLLIDRNLRLVDHRRYERLFVDL